ncbi:membrane progestin receptor alpha-like [Mizuhopecten yessoensis]|uniref:Membrane progestin receptor alpha n=1 Tax=Mizuhopecten yessoensis TaxID=6573 RepID=A0A210QSS0_MIZYE|nr:membrane progestin receptor alpha-like [Mizuhopecten yessoensis]OWF51793.1 Membrane progestin receptor alpha [Mizuhopecten yessoensis]
MKFPYSPPTLTLAERMPSEICKKHIHTGYLRPHQPWSYYVISVFQANNQTLNVWTHVIGFLYIAYRSYDISLNCDFLHDPMFRPLGAGLLCILTLLAASSFAHIFGDRSEVAHYTCFCMDYDAIGLYSMGCALISQTYFVRGKGLAAFLVNWSRPGCIYLAVQFSVLLSFSKIRFGRAHKLCNIFRALAVYSSYFWFMLPLIQRYFWQSKCYHDNTLGLHIYHVILFQLNVLVYIAHVPERWFPTTFDFIGQSHQLHHIILVVSVDNFLNVTLEEIKSLSSIKFIKYMTGELGTVENSYGSVLLVICSDCVLIAVAALFAIMKVSHSLGERKHEQQCKSHTE